jgi:paraquat-inducible protein A
VASPIENVLACPDCDLLQRIPSLPPGGAARCPRCGGTISANKRGGLDRVLALTVSALICFFIANVDPLMNLSVAGRESSTTILGGAVRMWQGDEKIAAVVVTLFAVVAPALDLGCTLAVLLFARRPPAPRWVGTLLRWSELSGLWAMVEVMMLGILVALVKIASVARVYPGIGIFAAGALVLLMAAISAGFDRSELWSRVRWANGDWPPAPPGNAGAAEAAP